ncbi:MAG: ribonuclease BN, partial [Gammaproteobacteria bacterium]|nr:ribonuclease BN [Gammaproteobacteria bacterium]
VPAHDPAGITLKALLDAVRAQEQGAGTEVGRSLPEVERALERLDAAFGEGLGGLTVRDLVGPSPRGPETPGRSKM